MVSPTLLTYYLICQRKAWLFTNGINMEQTSDVVYEGKLISETSYAERSKKYTELDLGIAKIDFYDSNNKVVHEVKKSNKLEYAHEWQVKYYLYLLEDSGIQGATGVLEYPKLRKKKEVFLSDPDREFISKTIEKAKEIKERETAPPLQKKTICKSCSYFEFCWSGEERVEGEMRDED